MTPDPTRDSLRRVSSDFGVYVHIPFCEQHCHYCAFPVVVMPESAHASYNDLLLTEIERAGLPEAIDTLYLGGGTPSLLSPAILRRLVDALPSGAREVTIEANPGTLTDSRLDAFSDLGVNRVSLGAQSFDAADLRSAGRLHRPEDSIRDFETLRARGFDNISIDLIAGLPQQSRQAWERNLDWLGKLAPDHVSIYLLDSEDSSLWGRKPPALQSEEDYVWFYHAAAERLGELGYRHYEISSWSRPGRESRHNTGYWNGRSYRGVGLGAHSFTGGKRFWNTRSMSVYRDRITAGGLPVDAVEERTVRIRLEEAFLLGLRQVDGFDVWVVAKDLQIDYPQEWFERRDALIEAGFLQFDGTVLSLTPSGWLLAAGIVEELLCPTLLSTCEATR